MNNLLAMPGNDMIIFLHSPTSWLPLFVNAKMKEYVSRFSIILQSTALVTAQPKTRSKFLILHDCWQANTCWRDHEYPVNIQKNAGAILRFSSAIGPIDTSTPFLWRIRNFAHPFFICLTESRAPIMYALVWANRYVVSIPLCFKSGLYLCASETTA